MRIVGHHLQNLSTLLSIHLRTSSYPVAALSPTEPSRHLSCLCKRDGKEHLLNVAS